MGGFILDISISMALGLKISNNLLTRCSASDSIRLNLVIVND